MKRLIFSLSFSLFGTVTLIATLMMVIEPPAFTQADTKCTGMIRMLSFFGCK